MLWILLPNGPANRCLGSYWPMGRQIISRSLSIYVQNICFSLLPFPVCEGEFCLWQEIKIFVSFPNCFIPLPLYLGKQEDITHLPSIPDTKQNIPLIFRDRNVEIYLFNLWFSAAPKAYRYFKADINALRVPRLLQLCSSSYIIN
jgi:hypothetical protein